MQTIGATVSMTLQDIPGFSKLGENTSLAYVVIVVAIFGVGTIGSLVNWQNNVNRANTALVTKYQQELNQSKSIITQNLTEYASLLDDGTSLLAVDGSNLTQAKWLAFFQSYGLTNNYPGVDAVSYSAYVPASNLASYTNMVTSQGQPNFAVKPAGARSAYTPITYIGYTSPTSLEAMGYDQLTDPVRGTAITTAMNTGNITMSGKVTLVAVHKQESAFIIFKPVFSGAATTLAQRQSSISGFVFIAVNSNDFFKALLARYVPRDIAIQIYDGQAAKNNLLYQTNHYEQTVTSITNPIYSTISVAFGGRVWQIKIITAKSLLQAGASQSSNSALVLGIGLSGLVAAVVWYFTYYRERKLYWQKQNELQDAKDELLSLASHQLRTPATIVKQYLGILLQNYGGTISAQQRKILQTAYDSNERQLEIANQFLEAARLGSGRIELHRKVTTLNDTLINVVSEQQKIARERRQKVVFNNPKRIFRVDGDPKYLPMVFENLINNALKYSKRGAKVTVTLQRAGPAALIHVADQGIGIAPEELPTLFEKFSHASNEQNASGNSTGIGLYLAQQIAQLHGGDITVESTPGKGSTFSVRLPLHL